MTRADLLDNQGDGPDYRQTRPKLIAVAQRLIDLYPNNTAGYFRLGVILRQQGKYDESTDYFARIIQLNPRIRE